MTLCRCGCGQEAKEGNEFIRGHYGKWKSQQTKIQKENTSKNVIESIPKEEQKAQYLKKKSIFTWFKRKPKTESRSEITHVEMTDSPLELKEQKLPRWVIKESKPFFFNPKKRAKLTQLVFLSRKPPYQEYMWANTDDLIVSVGQKGFKMPEAIHGGIVFWDGDKDEPLLQDTKTDTQDSETTIDSKTGEILGSEKQTALKTGMIKNYYFMLGKLEGARQLFEQLGLIKILQIITVVAILGLAYITYKDMSNSNIMLQQILTNVTRMTSP